MAATLPQQVSSHERWLGEHERRLTDHDKNFDAVDERVANLRVDLAKLLAMGLIMASILSTVATALIVHYLTPVQLSPSSPPTAVKHQ